MRVSGFQRQRVAEQLGASYAAGLLSHETLSMRLDRLYRVRDFVDLRALVRDLPSPVAKLDRVGSAVRRLFERVHAPPSETQALRVIPLEQARIDEVLIGRASSCDLSLSDVSVSRRHAMLRCQDEVWSIRDLGSTNSTCINGVKVGRAIVRPGDHVRFGAEELLFD
jgi:hypothetical protein